jgi:hypothetical protein
LKSGVSEGGEGMLKYRDAGRDVEETDDEGMERGEDR